MKKLIRHMLNDHLYKNASYLFLDSILLTAFGFFFWTINTRLFTAEQVGLASTLLSSAELIVSLALLGFNIALVRYLPKSDQKDDMISSCFIISAITSLLISLVFVFKIGFFSPKLAFLKSVSYYWVLFIIFIMFFTLFYLIEAVFVAFRKANLVFIKNLIFSILKLIFPFLLVFMGAFGIFSSWMFSLAIAFVISLFFIPIKFKLFINKKIIREMFNFSFINYIARFLKDSTQLVLPIMITNLVNPETTAYFYISFMIAGLLFIIPSAVSSPLLVEGSLSQDDLKNNIKKSLKFTFSLLTIGIILVMLLGKYLLLLFGTSYSENGLGLLQILALSSIPFAINMIYITIKNVQKKIKMVLLLNLSIAVGTLSLSYLLLGYGLVMVGFSWLIAQSLVAIFSLTNLVRVELKND